MVTLPFECCNMLPLPWIPPPVNHSNNNHAALFHRMRAGLLLQRQADPAYDAPVVPAVATAVDHRDKDNHDQQAQQHTLENNNNNNDNNDNDNKDSDDFPGASSVLMIHSSLGTTTMMHNEEEEEGDGAGAGDGDGDVGHGWVQAGTTVDPNHLVPVASLFSLEHPLEDVLPVWALPPTDAADTNAPPATHGQKPGVIGPKSSAEDGTGPVPLSWSMLQPPSPTCFTSVWDDLIWMGPVTWTTTTKTTTAAVTVKEEKSFVASHTVVLAVTYDVHKGRHAIWHVQEAPPPPPPPTVRERIQWMLLPRGGPEGQPPLSEQNHPGGYLEMLGAVPDWDHPEPDDVLMTTATSMSTSLEVPPTTATTRDAALADALGLSNSRTNAYANANTNHYASSAGLFSPPSRGGVVPQLPAAVAPTPRAQLDTSFFGGTTGNNSSAAAVAASSPYLTHGGRSAAAGSPTALHAGVALQCLYEEGDSSSSPHQQQPQYPRAEQVFVVSNESGSGELLLCLVSPATTTTTSLRRTSGEKKKLKEIRFFSIVPVNQHGSTNVVRVTIQPLPQATRTCHAAAPLSVIPRPACFASSWKGARGRRPACCTDWLLLTPNQTLSLCRATHPMVDCQLPLPEDAMVTGLMDAVQNQVTIQTKNGGTSSLSSMRARLSLQSNSALAERVLQALDTALVAKQTADYLSVAAAAYSTSKGSLPSSPSRSIKGLAAAAAAGSVNVGINNNKHLATLSISIRADVCRLEQYLTMMEDAEVSSKSTLEHVCDDVGWVALETVLLSLLELSLPSKPGSPHKSAGAAKATLSQGVSSSDCDQQQHGARNETNADAWDAMLQSDFHQSYEAVHHELGLPSVYSTCKSMSSGSPHLVALETIKPLSLGCWKKVSQTKLLPLVFDSIHMIYEDCKLTASSKDRDLLRLGSLLVRFCFMVDPNDLTVQRFLDYYRLDNVPVALSNNEHHGGQQPLRLSSAKQLTTFAVPPSFLQWVDDLMAGQHSESFYSTAGLDDINANCVKLRSAYHVLSILFTSKSPSRDLDVVLALIEEGFTDASLIQEELPAGIAVPLLEVLYRCRNDPSLATLPGWSPAAWILVGRNDLSKNMLVASSIDPSSVAALINTDAEEHAGMDDPFADKDNDGLVPLEKSSAMLFPDDNRIHEAARLLRSSRPVFLRVARAPEVGDHDYERLKQKQLLLLSRRTLALPVGRGMLSIGGLRLVPAELLPLPELCLKGRVPPTNASLALDDSECPSDMRVWPEFHNGVAAGLRLPAAGESGLKITRTWIVYNRPPLTTPSQTDNEDASTHPHRRAHTHGGLLLALGLRGHLTALDMSDVYDYLTHGSVTTTVGVLLGMAANKRGSCDMAVSKMLCLHIPSLIPQHFSAIDVASAVQAASVTGAGMLFQRSSHRMMTEFLLNEIGKRPDSDASAFDREAYTLACGLALGMVNLCLGEKSGNTDRAAGIADLQVEERLYRYIVGGVDFEESHRTRETNDRFSLPSASPNGDNERCSTIYEGDLINTHVTSPGATLALGLMYMKTGDHTIASALSLPETHFLLEFVRPDFLGLRVIARSLILWEDVKPTKQWIDDQIPAVVLNAYAEMRSAASRELDGDQMRGFKKKVDYDRRAVRQIYCHVLAGACFGMGLRYAGTGDIGAKAALFERVLELQMLREGTDAASVASRPEFPILDSCLGCAAISLAMVMAGTGDLEALKLFKILRWRCEEESRYGTHMVFGMATGLLFLGGGTCTLGRDPEDIAALVTAFFPRFPTTTSDNQYHLQALRHLYALAVKRRQLKAIDVDTGKTVPVPIELSNVKGARTSWDLPCLVRNFEIPFTSLRVTADGFYPMQLALTGKGQTLFVKRHFSSKSHGIEHSRNFPYQAFREYLILPSDSDLLNRILHEACGTPETLRVYLELLLGANRCWDLRLLRTYYQRYALIHPSAQRQCTKPLLNVELLLACLHEKTERGLVFSTNPHTERSFHAAIALYAQ